MKSIFAFAIGAAIGSAVTYILLKTKFEEAAREDVESVKEMFQKKEQEKEDSETYKKYAENYSDFKEVDESEEPEEIDPDEAGEDGYELVTCYYYADGTVTERVGVTKAGKVEEVVINQGRVDDILGLSNINQIDEEHLDGMYIRNKGRHTDYEVIRVNDSYK